MQLKCRVCSVLCDIIKVIEEFIEKSIIFLFVIGLIHKAKIVILYRSNCSYITFLHRCAFNLKSYTAPLTDFYLLIIRYPSIPLAIVSVEHVFRHGMFRDEDAEGANIGKKTKGVTLRHSRVKDFVDKRTKEKGGVFHVEHYCEGGKEDCCR